jgi:hypothetical protein
MQLEVALEDAIGEAAAEESSFAHRAADGHF